MDQIKNPQTTIVLVILTATILICCNSVIFIPFLITGFTIELLSIFLAILFFISSFAILLILILDHRIYKKNLQILEKNYQTKIHLRTNEILKDTKPLYIKNWCREISKAEFYNEKEVETKFLYPLIRFLGHKIEDVRMQYSMKVPIGRQSVGAIADFVVFNPKTNEPQIILEAKPPTQKLDSYVQNQARSYAFTLNAPYYLITNGVSLYLYERHVTQDLELLFISIDNLHKHWDEIANIIGVNEVAKD